MRCIPFFLPLLLLSSVALAQTDGVMVLKSDQPYVSPFDKALTGRPTQAQAVGTTTEIEPTQGEGINVELREIDKQETQKRAQIFVAKKPPKQVLLRKVELRKIEPTRKVEELPAVVKQAEPKKVATTVTGAISVQPNGEASSIPPLEAQNPKAVLAPPPALAVKENGLTKFDKETPNANRLAPVVPVAIAAVSVLTTSEPFVSRGNIDQNDTIFPAWVLKAIMFFIIGGLMMLGVWYWIKRQALYGDPAFHDPWFRPSKS